MLKILILLFLYLHPSLKFGNRYEPYFNPILNRNHSQYIAIEHSEYEYHDHFDIIDYNEILQTIDNNLRILFHKEINSNLIILECLEQIKPFLAINNITGINSIYHINNQKVKNKYNYPLIIYQNNKLILQYYPYTDKNRLLYMDIILHSYIRSKVNVYIRYFSEYNFDFDNRVHFLNHYTPKFN
jgi:hypothetical protein